MVFLTASLEEELTLQSEALREERTRYESLKDELRGMEEQNNMNKLLIEVNVACFDEN